MRETGSVDHEAIKKENLKRNGKKSEEKKNLLFAVGESDKAVFRRTSLNSQNTPYTCEQFIETEVQQTQPKRLKKSPSMSESVSRSDSTRPVIEREFSDKASETHSNKNHNAMDDEPSTSDMKASSNKSEYLIIEASNKLKAKAIVEEESKSISHFKQQAILLKNRFNKLQDLLVSYLRNQDSVMAISNLVQECLNEFSVEYLSSSELMEYLTNDMGKLLHSLLAILEEFESVAKESKIVTHSTVIFEIE